MSVPVIMLSSNILLSDVPTNTSSSTVPVPVPTPVAMNIVPGLLSAAPISVKLVVPVVLIV